MKKKTINFYILCTFILVLLTGIYFAVSNFSISNDNSSTSTDNVVYAQTLPSVPTGATSWGDIYNVSGTTNANISGIKPRYFNLDSYVIPKTINGVNITSISTSVFEYSNATYIYFQDGSYITSLPEYCFAYCANLTSIDFGTGSIISSFGRCCFAYCSSLSSIAIPSSVKTFADGICITGTQYVGVFGQCRSLESITFEEDSQLTYMGKYCFEGCSSLTSITIPSEVTSLPDGYMYDLTYDPDLYFGFFTNCNSLTNVYFAENSKLSSIGSYCFYCCRALTSIDLPASVNSLGGSCFSSCTQLSSVTIVNDSELLTLGDSCFSSCASLTSFTIPSNVTYIGSSCFSGCIGLTSFSIPSSVISLGSYCFSGCSAISSFTFASGSSLTSIGSSCFNKCSSLTSIEIPSGVVTLPDGYSSGTTVYNSLFNSCTSLNTVLFAESSQITSIGTYCFANCTSLTNFSIPNSVTTLKEGCFFNCNALTNVAIPNSVTYMGSSCFYGCTKIENVTIPNTISSLGSNCFEGCSKLSEVTFADNSTLQRIGGRCFWETALTSITIPASVTIISQDSYQYGVFPKSIRNVYFAENSQLTTLGNYCFEECNSLTSIDIPNSVTTLGRSCFSRCYSLKNIIIPNSVTSIGEMCFYGCSGITAITIPDGITNLGQYCFNGCSNLVSIDIPDSVTSFGENCFYGCTKLASMVLSNNVVSFGASCFRSCTGLTLTIPSSFTNLTGGSSSSYFQVKTLIIQGSVSNGERSIIPSINNSTSYTSFAYVFVPQEDIATYQTSWTNYVNIIKPSSFTVNYTLNGGIGDTSEDWTIDKIITQGFSIQIPTKENYAFAGWFVNSNLSGTIYNNSIPSSDITLYAKWLDNPAWEYVYTYTLYGTNATITGLNSDYASLINLTIPSTVTTDGVTYYNVVSVGNSAFASNSIVQNILFLNGINQLVNESFRNCTSLKSVNFSDDSNLTTLGQMCFYNCTSLSIVTFASGGLVTIGVQSFSGCSSLESITIPNSVTSLGENCFYGCTSLQEIIFNDGSLLNTINNYCFSGCSSLINITIPSNVVTLGSAVFQNCTNLQIITFATNSPIISLKERSFYYCTSLASITFPSGLVGLGNECFYNCTSLSNITLPGGLSSIGSYCFYYCKLLTSITIPSSVLSMGGGCFASCISLTSVTFHSDCKIKTLQGFQSCVKLTSINIPSSVTTLGSSCFQSCTSLTNLVIPSGITSLENACFYRCTGISSFVIPSSVTSIGGSCFSYNNTLTSITFEQNSSLTTIGSNCFENCMGITSITIPAKVTTLGSSCFQYCDNLVNVTFESGSLLTSIGDTCFRNCGSLTNMVLPSGLTNIGKTCFYNCYSLVSINIPAGVISLLSNYDSQYSAYYNYYGAFENCTSLTTITFAPNGQLTTLGGECFRNCSKLANITLPTGLSSMGCACFSDCVSLLSIEVPSHVTQLLTVRTGAWENHGTFENCYRLQSITFGDNSVLNTIDGRSFYGCNRLTSIKIPKNITSLSGSLYGDSVGLFSYCNRLGSVTFESGSLLTSIGSYCFSYCYGLKNIIIPAGVTSLGDRCFYYCTNLEDISFESGSKLSSIGTNCFSRCTSLTGITIPKTVTSLGNNNYNYSTYSCFGYCYGLKNLIFEEGSTFSDFNSYLIIECNNLEKVKLPDGVVKLNDSIFSDRRLLKSVTFGAESKITSFGNSCFSGCSALTELDIPSTVTNFGTNCFYNCRSLTNIIIPNGITSLPNYCFYGCYNLLLSSIPASVISIGNLCFASCYAITNLVISSSIQTLGACCFMDCLSVTSVTFEDTCQITVLDGTFCGCTSLTSIIVPSSITTMTASLIHGSYKSRDGVFTNCSNLTSVVFANNSRLTYIGESCFTNCSMLTYLYIPDGVSGTSSNGEQGSTFYHCTNLIVSVPSTVNSIGGFYGVRAVILRGSVYNGERLSIPKYGYYNSCVIYVPREDINLYKADSSWYSHCIPNPLRITLVLNGGTTDNATGDQEIIDWQVDDMIDKVAPVMPIPTKENYTFAGWYTSSGLSGSPYVFSTNITTDLSLYAKWVSNDVLSTWYDMYNYRTVVENDITYAYITGYKSTLIGIPAFVIPRCVDSTYQYIVKGIDTGAICSYNLLQSITFVEDSECEIIASGAFTDNTSLTEVFLPSTITNLNVNVFTGCNRLTNIEFSSSNAVYKTINGAVYSKDGTKLICVPQGFGNDFVIDSHATSIENYAFDTLLKLTKIDLSKIKTIKAYAFKNCTNLNVVTITPSVESINALAFTGTPNITSMVIRGTLTGITTRTNYPTAIGNIVPVTLLGKMNVYVPNVDLATYASDLEWNKYVLYSYSESEGAAIYSVTFEYDGGTGSITTLIVISGSTLPTMENPTKIGYSFTGYKTVVNDIVSDNYFDMTSDINSDLTLRAMWEAIVYHIYYYVNGGGYVDGVFTESPQVVDYTIESFGEDRTTNIDVLSPERVGYNFIGWYTNKEFDSAKVMYISYNNLTLAQIAGTESITLFGKWAVITFDIVIQDGEGYVVGVVNGYSNPTPYNEDMKFNITFNTGYTQNTADNLVVTLINGDESIVLTATTENGIIYYTISNVLSNMSVTISGVRLNTYSVYFRNGSKGYSNVTNMPSTLTLTWGSSIVEQLSGETLLTPQSVGYVFKNWHLVTLNNGNEDIDLNAYSFDTIIYEDTILVADWNLTYYAITYQINGGKLGISSATYFTNYYTIEDTIILPTDSIAKTGYTFGGWYSGTTLNDGVYDFTSAVLVTQLASGSYGDREYVASWTITTYHITYNTNNGTLPDGYVDSFTIEDNIILPTPTYAGHSFNAWYQNSSLSGNTLSNIDSGSVTNDLVLYASWATDDYSITYNLNGDELSPVTINGNTISYETNTFVGSYTYNADSAYVLPTLVTRPGYVFRGWFDNTALSGDRLYSIQAGVTGNKTYYASWGMVNYSIPLNYSSVYGEVTTEPTAVSFTYADFEANENKISIYTPSLSGYFFTGWFDQNSVLIPYITPQNCSSITSLTAGWSNESYTITLTGDNVEKVRLLGGSGAIEAVYGGTIKFVIDYVDSTYNGSTLSVSYVSGSQTEYTTITLGDDNYYSITNITGDLIINIDGITLNKYSISFVSNGGSAVADILNINHGSTISAPTAPTKSGYNFVEWCTDINLTTSYNFDSAVTYSMILYAKWNIITYNYTITNNVNSSTLSGTYNVENNVIFTSNHRFNINGYSFDNWYIDSISVVSTAGHTGDIDIIAKYNITSYSITYSIDNGQNSASNVTGYNINDKVVLYGATKTGYNFTSWTLEDGSNATLSTNTTGLPTGAIGYIAIGSYGNVVLTANFTLQSESYFELTFTIDGLIYTQRAVLKNELYTGEMPTKNKIGYNFIGWYDQSTNTAFDFDNAISSNATLYAEYQLDSYNITYNFGTLTNVVNTNPTTYSYTDSITLVDASKLGYLFGGWYTDNLYTTAITTIVNSTGNLTLFGKLELVNYAIEYVLNGGTNNTDNPTTYNVLSSLITLRDATKSGYTFGGWQLVDGTPIIQITPTTCTNYVLVATYDLIVNEYVEINYYFGSGLLKTVAILKNSTPDSYTPNNPLGRTFVNWYTDAELQNEYTLGAVATSINLYGKFNCTTYAITYMYEKEGEIINTNPTTFNVDSVITLVNPTLLGYTFNGWYMGTNLTTTIYNTAQNITLTGKFTATNYSITYMDGGTEITSSTNASAYSVENNATFTAYDKVGYEFVRWINKGQTILNTNSKTGDLVLYSEYTPITYTITYSFNNSVGTPNNNNISSYNIITNYNLRDASVKGYNFVGWFIGNTQINTITNMYDNIEIVGKFAVITYTITYTMDDGVVNTNPLTYTIEDEDFALVNATFGTREFLGWREANRVITTIDTNRAENITLAAWFYTADESNTTTTNANLTTILIAVGAGVMLITIMSLSIIISKLRQHQKVDAERILKLLNQLNKTDQEIMSTKQNNNNNSNQRRN